MYNAIIARITTRPLEGSDNIQLGTVLGYQVIVGTNVKDGDLGVFFESGGQISTEYATANDCIRRKDENGNAAGGFFEENRRVRAIKLRGARSDGFFAPLSTLEFTGVNLNSLKEGDQFDELNGKPICNKYFTEKTLKERANKQNQPRKDNPFFKKHIDTENFLRCYGNLPTGSEIVITEKLHGTSGRYGNVQTTNPIKRGWLKRTLAKWLNAPTEEVTYEYLNGSRNVTFRPLEDREGYHGKEAFRINATKHIVLHKGEMLYFELVGFTEGGAPIMGTQSTVKLKDKAISSQYGKEITYTYGCAPGKCKMYVYRITRTNADGIVTELSWNQVEQRCHELGLQTVPVITKFAYDGGTITKEVMFSIVESLTNGANSEPYPSMLDDRHISEGVVVRCESQYGTSWLKSKSTTFGMLEGYIKDDANYVDTEEAS